MTGDSANSNVAPTGELGAQLVVDAEHFERIVRGGIARAEVCVDIATADFKAMMVPDGTRRLARSIVDLFRELTDRGVEIRLLHSGVPSRPALEALRREIPAGLTIRRCPRQHAKLVVVDSRAMYVGSANLTGAGLGAKSDGRRNFEMGFWTHATGLIDRALEHFNALWEGHRCKECQRKAICPVPLEEPRLR